MRTYQTNNELKVEVEALYRNITGRAQLTAIESDIVASALIDSYQEVLLEYGITEFRFQEVDVTVDTVSGQRYADLDEYVFKIVTGSARIAAENNILVLMDEVGIYQSDPGADANGQPTHYAYGAPDDPNIIRVVFWPIPDAVYTVSFKVLKYPADVTTNFPVYLMSAIKYKAKSLACLNLGMPQLQPSFDKAYENIIAKVKDGFEEDGPKHVSRTVMTTSHSNVQGRLPT